MEHWSVAKEKIAILIITPSLLYSNTPKTLGFVKYRKSSTIVLAINSEKITAFLLLTSCPVVNKLQERK